MSLKLGQSDPHPIKVNLDSRAQLSLGEGPGTFSAAVFNTEATEASRLWAKLRKHWRVSALFAVTVFAVVVAITFATKPSYEPVAQLEIDPQGTELINTANAPSPDLGTDEYMGTANKKLMGDELAIAVIRKLNLDQAPEFTAPPNAIERLLATIKSRTSSAGIADAKSATTEGKATRLTTAENLALDRFHQRLKVQRDPTSRIISVSYSSTDPVLAATVTNAVLTTFIQMTYAQREADIAQRSSWLEAQLSDVRSNLEASTRALGDFQKATGIADVDLAKNTVSQQLDDLGRQETMAMAERTQLESLFSTVTSPDAVSDVQKNLVVQELSKKLAETQVELKEQEVIYGENHPAVIKLKDEAAELQHQLNLQTNAIMRSLKTNYAAAQSRQRAIAAQVKAASGELGKVARYNELKKDVETNTNLANDLYRRIKEAGITAGARVTDMEIVGPARVLDRPSRPNWTLNLAAGALIGLLGGILIGFIRESFDSKIHAVEDLRGMAIASSVSFIPEFGSDMTFRERALMRKLSAAGAPEMYLQKRPRSPESEALRSLGSCVMLARESKSLRVILVTSALPREGKSTLAVNFASALSRHGKTCLIDADLRAPKVGRAFGITSSSGLSELLSGQQSIHLNPVTGLPNLMVLTAGKVGANSNPADLLSSDAMRKILDSLRLQFDSVVIDSPPLLPFAEARVLSTLVDGIIMVCRYGVTTRGALAQSESVLRAVSAAPVIEIVMNGALINSGDYAYYGYERKTSGAA